MAYKYYSAGHTLHRDFEKSTLLDAAETFIKRAQTDTSLRYICLPQVKFTDGVSDKSEKRAEVSLPWAKVSTQSR